MILLMLVKQCHQPPTWFIPPIVELMMFFFALTTLYPHDISDISIISPSLRTPGMAQGRGFDALSISGEELRMETGDCTIHFFFSFEVMFL